MKIKLALVFILCFGFLSSSSLAKDITVGEFALKYANALNLKLSNEHDAVRALIKKNLISNNLKIDFLLTEKILVDIFNDAGFHAFTYHPGNVLDEDSADSAIAILFASFNSGISGSSAPQDNEDFDDEDPNNSGKKTRPKDQKPNSNANPNAFYGCGNEEG